VRKRAPTKRRARRAQRVEIVPVAPARVWWGPRIGSHPSPSEARPRQLFSDLRRASTRPVSTCRARVAQRNCSDSAERRSRRLDSLEGRVVGVVKDIVARRVRVAALEHKSREIAENLLVWEDRWRRWRHSKSAAPIPEGLLGESGLARAIVKEIEGTQKRRLTNYDGRLHAAIKEQRGRVDAAEEGLRRAKNRPKGALVTLAKAIWRLRAERVKHAALIRELNTRRVIDPKVSGKRILPREYALGPLLNGLFGLFRCGVPDRGIAKLLQLVELPHLSERQIKRIRSRS
jgi:hypothetical protein